MSNKICIGNYAPNNEYVAVGYRKNIDDFAQNSECTEIYAPDILDYINESDRSDFISHLASKLRRNGQLIIGGTDIISVSLAIFNKQLNITEANELLYGNKNQPPKQSLTSLEQLRTLLIALGLKIERQFPGEKMLVVARRA